MLKRIAIVTGIVSLVAVIGLGLLVLRLAGMDHRIKAEQAKISKVDLLKVADGVYSGNYGNFVVSAKVVVAVKAHRIASITIVDQNCGPGYKALETVDRIIKAQSPKVDVVTGASSSSRTIMIAVYRALKQRIK